MDVETGLIALGAAISVFGGALGTAWAQSAIGSAGMGVLAEKPEQFVKVMLLVVIPETIVILGFVIAFFLIGKIPAPVL
ncbi:MAG: ATPase [Candidatus Altiarchaeota archaeon]